MSDVKLSMEAGKVMARLPDRDEAVPVQVVYARPLSARREIVLLDGDAKEVATLPDVEALDDESRDVARAALRGRYQMPRITRVQRVELTFGTRYWEVETDRGTVAFAVREPGRNVTWLTDDHVVIRDTMGGRFEVESLAALDVRSRRAIRRML